MLELGWVMQTGQGVKSLLPFLLALCSRLHQELFQRCPHGLTPLALLLLPHLRAPKRGQGAVAKVERWRGVLCSSQPLPATGEGFISHPASLGGCINVPLAS